MKLDDLPTRIRRWTINPDTGCWEWTGSIGRTPNSGYGKVRWDGRSQRAHRVIYELLVGKIPEGLQLDHLCRVRHCVNPDHLEPVTQRENILRGIGFCAINALTTHCPAGHAYAAPNACRTVRRSSRSCRLCHNEQESRRREARKARVS